MIWTFVYVHVFVNIEMLKKSNISYIELNYCQARLLLFSAQIFKLYSQSLNSETKGAELMLKSQLTTHHHQQQQQPPPDTFQSW